MRMFCLAAAAALSGCVYIEDNSEIGRPGGGGRPGLAPLYAASVERDGVHIWADSHGCTGEDSFQTVVFRDGGRPDSGWFHVRFERLSVDQCEAFVPGGVELVYSFTRLGLPPDANVIVDNPTNRR
jgi:hypothetical protein